MAKFAPALCLLLLAFVHTGYALKCYACDSKTNPKCNDPFSKDNKIPSNECASAATTEGTCIKLTYEDAGVTNVRRYCLSSSKNTNPCDQVKTQNRMGTIKECEFCREDDCNTAGNFIPSTYAIIATSVIAMIFARA